MVKDQSLYCTMCAKDLEEADAVWATDNGWIVSGFGSPYCEEHVPAFHSLQLDEIGPFIAKLRKSGGFSQPAFASVAGISAPTLAKIEKGSLNIHLHSIEKIFEDGFGIAMTLIVTKV